MKTQRSPAILFALAIAVTGSAIAVSPVPQDGASDVATDRLKLPDEEGSMRKILEKIDANAETASKQKAVFVDALGIDETELSIGIGDRVSVAARIDAERIKTLVQIGEYAHRRLDYATFGKLNSGLLKPAGGRQFFYQVDRDSYDPMISDVLTELHPRAITKAAVRGIIKESLRGGGLSMSRNSPPMELSKNEGYLTSWVANSAGFCWTAWACRRAALEVNIKSGQSQGTASKGRGRGNMVTWLISGVGVWSSMDAVGINRMHRFTRSIYAKSGKRQRHEDNDMLAMAYEVATNKVSKKIDVKNFYQLTRSKLNDLTDLDLAVAWSVVDYMIKQRNAEWSSLIKLCGRVNNFRFPFVNAFGTKKSKDAAKLALKNKDDRALDTAYIDACRHFEGQWRKWAKSAYRAAYRDPSKANYDSPFQPFAGQQPDDDDEEDEGKKKKKKKRRRRK